MESKAQKYRAAVCTEIGKPLSVQDMPANTIGEGMVKVKVHYGAVNFSDILIIQGKYQEKMDLPFVPGSEFSGEVVEVGDGVSHLRPGDKVFGFGRGVSGGCFAEEILMPGMMLRHIPSGTNMDTAAAFVISYGTAWMALKRLGQIKPGQTVLVTAAAGAVGLATVDLAANVFGAKVIGACGGPQKCALVQKYGAVKTIDYSCESIRERVKEFTQGDGVDLVVDQVGGDIFTESMRSIAFEGRLIVVGFASGKIPQVAVNRLLVKNISLMGLYWGSYAMRNPPASAESIAEVAKLVAEGKVKPHVSQVFPLSRINDAIQHIIDRKNTGKVLVNCKL